MHAQFRSYRLVYLFFFVLFQFLKTAHMFYLGHFARHPMTASILDMLECKRPSIDTVAAKLYIVNRQIGAGRDCK